MTCSCGNQSFGILRATNRLDLFPSPTIDSAANPLPIQIHSPIGSRHGPRSNVSIRRHPNPAETLLHWQIAASDCSHSGEHGVGQDPVWSSPALPHYSVRYCPHRSSRAGRTRDGPSVQGTGQSIRRMHSVANDRIHPRSLQRSRQRDTSRLVHGPRSVVTTSSSRPYCKSCRSGPRARPAKGRIGRSLSSCSQPHPKDDESPRAQTPRTFPYGDADSMPDPLRVDPREGRRARSRHGPIP